MSTLTLVIGNRNYSSWSLRAWILLRHLGLACREIRLPLDTPEFAQQIRAYAPTGRVPVLIDGDTTVWDSLAIAEYAVELAGHGWPQARAARAHARAASAEMHAGFPALRSACPFNARARGRTVAQTPALAADLARIDALWQECRARYGAAGPWLYGTYTVADAMYAPVASRLRTYGLAELSAATHAYVTTVLDDPLLAPWLEQAGAETERIDHEEVGL